jgi:two-component system response regulator PilR (NtrC family)
MSKARALIVDDEDDICDLVSITLRRMNIESRAATSIGEATHILASEGFDLCRTDMGLPDGSGIGLVRHTTEGRPKLPVAIITADGTMESAVAAMKAGAFDFVSKPVDLHLLRRPVESALRLGPSARHGSGRRAPVAELLGDSPQIRDIRPLIGKLARNQAPVFISGESGTGKEPLTAHILDRIARQTDRTRPAPPAELALGHYLDEVERQAILKALEETRWNRTAAARRLGMTLRSLRYRLTKLHID